MLFYSYAELVVGLIAVFFFTSKVFSIIKYKMYFALSLIFIILTASVACFLKDEQQYVILPVLHFIALTFLPLSLGHNRKIMLIFSSLFFSGLTFFIYSINQLVCSILHIELNSQSSAAFELISNLIVFGIFIILSSPLKIKTKLVVESITKPTIIMILIFLYLGGSMATFGTYYIIPSSDYRTIALKILTLIVSIVFSFSIPILLYNQIKKSRYMHENDIYERQLNAQINYYKSITTSGYELRKIRHDYNDLSIGLKSLINSRKYDEVLPLLQKYDSEIISSFQILYNTGNDLTWATPSISRPASTSRTRKATMLTKASGRFSRIPMRPSSTRKPLTMCSVSGQMSGATRTAGARPIPWPAWCTALTAAARCMFTAPTTESAIHSLLAANTPKSHAGRSAAHSTASGPRPSWPW